MRVLATAGTERGLEMLHQNNITSTFNHNEKRYIRQLEASSARRRLTLLCCIGLLVSDTRRFAQFMNILLKFCGNKSSFLAFNFFSFKSWSLTAFVHFRGCMYFRSISFYQFCDDYIEHSCGLCDIVRRPRVNVESTSSVKCWRIKTW